LLRHLAVGRGEDVHDVSAVADEPDVRLRLGAEDQQAVARRATIFRLVLERAVDLGEIGRARVGEARDDEQHRGEEAGETHGSLPSVEDRIP